jgi:hypothetical protein
MTPTSPHFTEYLALAEGTKQHFFAIISDNLNHDASG